MSTLVNPILRVTDNVTGIPIPGALIFFLSPGTSWPSGAKSAYYDLAMTVPAPNPLPCDGDGYASGAGNGIFLDGPYQIVATSPDGSSAGYGSVTYFEIPNFQGIGNAGQSVSATSYANFAAAVAAIGSTPTTLLIGTQQTLTANTIIPSTLTLQFIQGGSISLAGFSLTINSYFPRTGTNQWFTGTGTVIFGASALDFAADPAWFGGGSSGASAANAASINVIATFPGSNATPDVSTLAGINGTFKTNNSNATTYTNFSNMVVGQKFSVLVEDANSSFGGSIRNLPPSTPQYTALDFISDGTTAWCVGPPQAITPIFRNRLINAEMRIDQRNAGVAQTIAANAAVANAYCVDRWFIVPQGANIMGQQISLSSQWKNAYQITGAAGITSVLFGQRIESNNILDLAASNATVSLSAYIATSANSNVTWSAQIPTALDNYTSVANFANGVWSANSTLTRFSANFTMNANATNGLQVGLTFANLTTGTVQITGVQLEFGFVPTAFERRPDDIETMRCQRYLPAFRGANYALCPGLVATNGANGYGLFLLPFSVPARVGASNVVSSNVAGFGINSANLGTVTAANSVGLASTGTSQNAGMIICDAANLGAVGTPLWLFWNANNSFIYFTGIEL